MSNEINNEFNKNVPYHQFEGLNSVLTIKTEGLVKEKGDAISWLTSHGDDDKIVATTYAGIEQHHGKISREELGKPDFNVFLFEDSFLELNLKIFRGSKIDIISKTIDEWVKPYKALVSVKTSPEMKTRKADILVVVQMDRRVREAIAVQANHDLAKELEEVLKGAGVKLDKNRHHSFEDGDWKIEELSPHYSNPERMFGCKGNRNYVSAGKQYVVSTDAMMKYLEAIPYDKTMNRDWMNYLTTHKVKTGRIDKKTGNPEYSSTITKNSKNNTNLAIVNLLPGLIKYDENRQLPIVTRTVKNKAHSNVIKAGIFDDNALTGLSIWTEYGTPIPIKLSDSDLRSVALASADRNRFDSFFDYLASLPKWDGKKRLARMFIDSLGVEDTPMAKYLALVTTVGLIHLAKKPGSKMDFVIDLVGKQGVGKTTLIQKLCNSFGTTKPGRSTYGWNRKNMQWYTQGFKSFTEKDDEMQLAGRLFLNDDELLATERSTENELKEFATADSITFRPPYGKNMKTVDRRYVLYRTTNSRQVYISKNGQRKFWPMLVAQCPIKTPVVGKDCVWTPAYVDKLWAESVAIYLEMGDAWVDKLVQDGENPRWAEYRDLVHSHLQHTDDVTIDVIGYVNDMMAKTKPGKKTRIATQELLDNSGIGGDIKNQNLTKKISAIMQNDLKFKPGRVTYKGKPISGYISTSESADAVKIAVKAFHAEADPDDVDNNSHDAGQDDDDDILASLDL